MFVGYSQALYTMGQLKRIKGYAILTLDKLPTIQVDLNEINHNWLRHCKKGWIEV